nr:hypothetical protein CFP56_13235 [Quercus suber]
MTKHRFQQDVQSACGPKKEEFTVHEHVMRARTTFFSTANLASCKDGKNNVVVPNFEAAVFHHYLKYVYLGAATSLPDKDEDKCMNLAKTWILADALSDEQVANLIIDQIGSFRAPNPNCAVVNYSYHNTLPSVALRRLYVDIYIHEVSPESFVECLQEFPAEFREDLGTAWTRSSAKSRKERSTLDKILKLDRATDILRVDMSCPPTNGHWSLLISPPRLCVLPYHYRELTLQVSLRSEEQGDRSRESERNGP